MEVPTQQDVEDDPRLNRVFGGRYRALESLGEGGFATVYAAEDIQVRRRVALKVLHPELVAHEEAQRRFELEAQALATLAHPNIVHLVDFGRDGEDLYLVMELLSGRTLETILEDEGPLPVQRALEVLADVLRATSFAHARGVLHRDLKPGNVFLQRLDDLGHHTKILDFGLVKFATGPVAEGPPLTRLGTVAGTPRYMAPEQASGESMDARTDVYAAAVILFEMLSGAPPFDGTSVEVLRKKLLEAAPALTPSLNGRHAAPELEKFLRRGLATDPDDRFESAKEMLAALQALPEGDLIMDDRPAQSSAATRRPELRPVRGTSDTAPALPAQSPAAQTSAAQPPEFRSSKARSPSALHVVLLAVAGIGILGLVGIAAVAAVAWGALGGARDDQERTAVVDPERAGHESPAPAARSVSPAPVRSPWTADDLPTELRRSYQQLEREQASTSLLRRLRRYARAHADEPRARLLLGHAYTSRGWRSDALEAYESAVDLDPGTARADPKLLDSLVTLSSHGSAGGRASRLLSSLYGADALPAIDRVLARGTLTPVETTRLERVRQAL